MKLNFKYLIYVVSLALAATAAFYSITGLSKLFAANATAIIVMASVLETAKLISASYLHRYWQEVKLVLKSYLVSAVFVLMLITSLGIYGFLVSSYQETAYNVADIETQISLIENKNSYYENELSNFQSQIISKQERNNTLSSSRVQQENRLDSLYKKNWVSNAKRVEQYIATVDKQIQINDSIASNFQTSIRILQDSISKNKLKILSLNNNEEVTDIGPLKYIATITKQPVDSVVNYLILLLIFVFDPLAIILLISAQSIDRNETKPSPIEKNPIIEETIPENENMKRVAKIFNESDEPKEKVTEPKQSFPKLG